MLEPASCFAASGTFLYNISAPMLLLRCCLFLLYIFHISYIKRGLKVVFQKTKALLGYMLHHLSQIYIRV